MLQLITFDMFCQREWHVEVSDERRQQPSGRPRLVRTRSALAREEGCCWPSQRVSYSGHSPYSSNHRRRLGRQLGHVPPQWLRNAYAFTSYYQSLPPTFWFAPPIIVEKSMPVVIIIAMTIHVWCRNIATPLHGHLHVTELKTCNIGCHVWWYLIYSNNNQVMIYAALVDQSMLKKIELYSS